MKNEKSKEKCKWKKTRGVPLEEEPASQQLILEFNSIEKLNVGTGERQTRRQACATGRYEGVLPIYISFFCYFKLFLRFPLSGKRIF